MHFASVPAALVAFATVVSAVTHQVMVGQSGLAFNPSSVNASQGDMVQFIFYPKNHTVTQSTFAAPCQAMANGVDSSFQPVAAGASANPSMTIPVNSTDPVWFYCRQATYVSIPLFFFLPFSSVLLILCSPPPFVVTASRAWSSPSTRLRTRASKHSRLPPRDPAAAQPQRQGALVPQLPLVPHQARHNHHQVAKGVTVPLPLVCVQVASLQ